jgi:uncharacterized membrane protein
MRAAALVIALAAAATAVGLTSIACSPTISDNDASTCPNDLPQTCPSNVPSYQTNVSTIISQKCNQCHGDGGVAASKFEFTSYSNVYAARSSMLNQVYACRMPPADASALTPDERAAMLAWFVCHAPQN